MPGQCNIAAIVGLAANKHERNPVELNVTVNPYRFNPLHPKKAENVLPPKLVNYRFWDAIKIA